MLGTPTVSIYKHAWASLMQAVDASMEGMLFPVKAEE
jgi:hypothetical protein